MLIELGIMMGIHMRMETIVLCTISMSVCQISFLEEFISLAILEGEKVQIHLDPRLLLQGNIKSNFPWILRGMYFFIDDVITIYYFL